MAFVMMQPTMKYVNGMEVIAVVIMSTIFSAMSVDVIIALFQTFMSSLLVLNKSSDISSRYLVCVTLTIPFLLLSEKK